MRQGEPVQSLMLKPVLDLREEFGTARVQAFQMGPDGVLYFALLRKEAASRRLRVLAYRDDEKELDVEFMAPPFETHLVQPLGQDILLACSRCGCGTMEAGLCAAAVYDRQGKFLKPMNLGEGIANLQTTGSGVIWTGYLAEGEFGHASWVRPAEQPGLAAFDASGGLLHRYEASCELGPLDDCYALNSTSDRELWFIHFPSLALVHLVGDEIVGTWDLPLAGGCTLAIADHLVMYRKDDGQRDHFQVAALCRAGELKHLGVVRFLDEDGRSLEAARATARGSRLALLNDGRIYRHDARSAAAALTLT